MYSALLGVVTNIAEVQPGLPVVLGPFWLNFGLNLVGGPAPRVDADVKVWTGLASGHHIQTLSVQSNPELDQDLYCTYRLVKTDFRTFPG